MRPLIPIALICAAAVVGACGSGDGGASHVLSSTTSVTTADRTTTVTAQSAPMVNIELTADPGTCEAAARSIDVARFMSAFAAARRSGKGAEGCLSSSALDHYCDANHATCTDHDLDFAPGPNCLYACYGGTFDAMDVEGSPVAGGRYEIYAIVRYRGGTYEGANEAITVDSTDGRLLISEVTTSA